MIELKILNWMLRGPPEMVDVYMCIEPTLLLESYSGQNRTILREIQAYYSKYKTPPSRQILEDSLDESQHELLDTIYESDCEKNEIQFFIDELKKSFNIKLASDLSKIIDASSGNISNINQALKNTVVKIEKLGKNAVFSEGNFTDSCEERVNDYEYTRNNPNQVMGVFSGYKELDEYTWGIKNSEMLIISGATSSGKSLLMMNMGVNAWLGSNSPYNFDGEYAEDGKNVLFITLEMSKRQLEQRVDSNIARIRHRAVMRAGLTEYEMRDWEKSLAFQKNYDKRFYIVDMPRGTTTMEIEAKYDAIVSQFKPDLVCVDYLGIMKPNRSHGSDWEDLGHIAEDLHEFCRKKNIPLITAAQRKGKLRSLSKNKQEGASEDSEEIGRSKMIGDNSNIIFLLENRNEEHLREDMIVHITKNRDGPKGKVILLKDFEKSRIISAPDNWTGSEELENEV